MNPDYINSSHTIMTKADLERLEGHTAQGLTHRPYAQRADEGCYICWLLERNANLEKELASLRRELGLL